MSDATDYDPYDATLPGLDGDTVSRPVAAGNETAARRTLTALAKSGLYGEREAVIGEALLTCARQLDRAANNTRAKDYGVAQLLAQLGDLYDQLLPDDVPKGGSSDAFDQLAADLRAAAMGHGDLRAAAMGHGDAGRGAAVRDPAQLTSTD